MFMVGSGVAGAAPSMDILILGRVLQGLGGGGISVLCNVIVCDMFPLKQRGSFLAIVMAAVSVGTAIGPFLGGGECSYIFLSPCGPENSLILLLLFSVFSYLYSLTPPSPTWQLEYKNDRH